MNHLSLLHILRSQRKDILLAAAITVMLTACGVDRNIKKGEKYLALGEYYDAATQFKTAYQRTPPKDRHQRGELSLKLADCYSRISSFQRAIAAYRNAIRYKEDNGETHRKLAENLMKNGSYTEAVKEYRLAPQPRRPRGPADPDARRHDPAGRRRAPRRRRRPPGPDLNPMLL